MMDMESPAHPRVGGEDDGFTCMVDADRGSPPRRRGRHQPTTADAGALPRYKCTRSSAWSSYVAARLSSILAAVSRCVPYCSVSA